jgi:hypothetical protein
MKRNLLLTIISILSPPPVLSPDAGFPASGDRNLGEEAALRDLSNLSFTLVEDDGITPTVATVRFVATSPPTLRVEW